MAHPIAFERETHSGTQQGTSVLPGGNGSVFSRLPHYDLLTFMAMAQRIPSLNLLNFVPRFRKGDCRRGLSGMVHTTDLLPDVGIVFKRFHVRSDHTEETVYRALICEIMVLEHPILRKHRNIQELLGVAWDVQVYQEKLVQVLPVLVFKKADCGTLVDFMNSTISFMQRVQFCKDIGMAIEAMHGLNIVHGDIKPDNILIFRDGDGFVAKVIDFGCSCFGSKDDDLVLLSGTARWAAPEVSSSHMSIKAAKLADIYSYGMVCAWIFFGQATLITNFVYRPFNFDEAAELLTRQVGETELEQLQDTSLLVSASVRHLRNFFQSSFQAAHERRARDIRYLLDQLSCLSLKWKTRQDLINKRHSIADTVSAFFDPPGLSRMKSYIQASVAHLLVLLIRGRTNESFIPGQPQVVYDLQHSFTFGLLGLFVLSILGSVAMTYMALISEMFLKPLAAFAAFALLTPPVYWFCVIEKPNHFWYKIQHTWGSICIYGQTQHAIPRLSHLFTFLYKAHFLIREQLLRDLERRAQSGCKECHSEVALQLAFCYHTAFGTPRDVTASERWLGFAKNKTRYLERLCKEVNYGHVHSLDKASTALGFVNGAVDTYETYNKLLAVGDFDRYFEELLPSMIKRLSQEIDGKQASGVGLDSTAILYFQLGMIYSGYHDLESAEYYFKAVMMAVRELPSLQPFGGIPAGF